MRTVRHALGPSGEESALETLREVEARDLRRHRHNERRVEAWVSTDELSGLLRGAALDPRQAGVVRVEDLRAPSPPPRTPPPKLADVLRKEQEDLLARAREKAERERLAATRHKRLLRMAAAEFLELDLRGSKFVLDPDLRVVRAMDWAANAFCVYTVFAEPYLLVLEHYKAAPWILVFASVTAEIFFLIDLLAGPFKGFRIQAAGAAGMKKQLHVENTAKNYFRTWFLFDFPSRICPVQLIVWAQSHSFQSVDALFVFSILKLLMVVRIYSRLSSFLDRDLNFYRTVGLLKAVLTALLTCHWLACAWLLVLKHSTLSLSDEAAAVVGLFPDTCQQRDELVVNNTLSGKYLCAYYRVVQTVSTVAYGDMPATGFADRAFTMVLMFLGASFMYFQFVKRFGSATRDEELQFILERNALVDLMARRGIHDRVIEDTKAFYQHRWSSSKGFVDLVKLRQLPPNTRAAAFHCLYSELLDHVDWLNIRPAEDSFFWNFFVDRLEFATYLPGDLIRRADDPAHYDAIFIMLKGVVEEIHPSTGFVFEQYQGMSWFGEVEEITGRKRGAAIRVVKTCDVLELHLPAIQDIWTWRTMTDVKKALVESYKDHVRSAGHALWRHVWGKHKQEILKLSRTTKMPPAPWPRPHMDSADIRGYGERAERLFLRAQTWRAREDLAVQLVLQEKEQDAERQRATIEEAAAESIRAGATGAGHGRRFAKVADGSGFKEGEQGNTSLSHHCDSSSLPGVLMPSEGEPAAAKADRHDAEREHSARQAAQTTSFEVHEGRQAISSPLSQAKGWMRKQMSTRSSWMAAPWRFRNSMAQLGPSAGGENDGGSRDAVEDGGVSAAAAGVGTAIDAGWR